ncbi:MAG: bestrophin family ion channel [Mycobacterium sp.]|nr:bestrophin family ion channel [Mycobacterium sp.]
MLRPVGRLGAAKVAGLVSWQLRYDLLGIVIIAGLLIPVPDTNQVQYATAVLSVLGIGASVFIAFRNTTAYNRWWEARTLWGSQIINSRVLHNGLTSVDDGSAAMAAILDRMRRREVRYCWQLAAEMRGVAPLPGVTELTPEDPPGTDATELLNRQAADVQILAADGLIDQQARVMLMAANTGSATAQSGLERIRNEPFPIHYDFFIRMLAWFFGIMAFSRLDSNDHDVFSLFVGMLLMAVFVIAERLGHFIEKPMNNSIFDIAMYRFCGTITANLLGRGHPLAQPRESDTASVWM